jgi:predicted CoA-substrate-specific enzyme activase
MNKVISHRFAGVDVGSTTTKAVIINEGGAVVGTAIRSSGTDLTAAAGACLREALEKAGEPAPTHLVSTGYGRNNVTGADLSITEITCHGKGAYHSFPEAIIVVDIGGQDTKVIHLDTTGQRVGFKMNRKCSAGTGVFIEEIARRLEVPLEELDNVARTSTRSAPLNSYCTVFASTEMLSRIRGGEAREDLVLGAYESVVRRVVEMAELTGTLILTGGVVAFHPIVAELMARETGATVKVPADPHLVGALGAALTARELAEKDRKED